MTHRFPQTGDILLNRSLKKSVLELLFKKCHTFFIHCISHPNLKIGTKGLESPKEKKDGIVLVFGPHSMRHLSMDDTYLHCELQFNRWESLQIPYECIVRMFDKTNQVFMQWATFPNHIKPSLETETQSLSLPFEVISTSLLENNRQRNSVKEKKTRTNLAKKKTKKQSSRVIQVNFRGD